MNYITRSSDQLTSGRRDSRPIWPMGGMHIMRLALLNLNLLLAGLLQPSLGRRDVTVDELLVYGIVPPAPASASASSQPATTSVSSVKSYFPTVISNPDAAAFGDAISDAFDSGGARLSDSDFIFTTGTCMKRIRLANASRAWRGHDVRAFFLVDSQEALAGLNERGAPAGEAYAFFPSEGAPELGGRVRSLRAGDTRAAAAPFAAHRHFGETYKWMLYGDDDTVFFLEPVRRLLAGLDPDLPIALSDNLWYSDRHPNPQAPRCLPCHSANESTPSLERIMTTVDGRVEIRATYKQRGREGQLSKQEYLDFARNTTVVPGERYLPAPACPYCTTEAACKSVQESGSTAPCQASVAHGGAGMIFSVGLMRSLHYPDALSCFLSFSNASGGDHMVSECLWRHGVAFTDGGGLVRHLYNYHYVAFGGSPRLPLLLGLSPAAPSASVAGGAKCDATCVWMLRHAVSIHMHARLHKNIKSLATQQAAVPHARAAALQRLALRRRRAEGGNGSGGGGGGGSSGSSVSSAADP